MSDGQEDVSSQPLVIVRRRRNVDEPHHGGVWKIAYADFMTAMMAFFLVMWLINAADKKTIVQVAAYFNPMRLTDRFDAPKGLDDISEKEAKQISEKRSKTGLPHQVDDKRKLDAEKPAKPGIGETTDENLQKFGAVAGGKNDDVRQEEALFDNPATLFDKLAEEAKARELLTVPSSSEANVTDPFDRTYRERSSDVAKKPAGKTQPDSPHLPGKIADAAGVESHSPNEKLVASEPVAPAQTKTHPRDLPGAKELDPAKEHAAPLPPAKAGTIDKDVEAKKIAADISSAISKISRTLPNVEVKSTPEGLLVSLIDDAKFGMFEVGSAKPRAELVLVMDKIGNVLKGIGGNIVVRGHTDSRAYRSGNYDNWRLSASRAQMAHYMLVRGGIPESRFVAIEGRADRDPKVPSDTSAAQNRRIDILIRETPQ